MHVTNYKDINNNIICNHTRMLTHIAIMHTIMAMAVGPTYNQKYTFWCPNVFFCYF